MKKGIRFRNAAIFDAVPVTQSRVSASDFLEISEKTPDNIREVRFIPPRIGGKGFGCFDVKFSMPRFVIK